MVPGGSFLHHVWKPHQDEGRDALGLSPPGCGPGWVLVAKTEPWGGFGGQLLVSLLVVPKTGNDPCIGVHTARCPVPPPRTPGCCGCKRSWWWVPGSLCPPHGLAPPSPPDQCPVMSQECSRGPSVGQGKGVSHLPDVGVRTCPHPHHQRWLWYSPCGRGGVPSCPTAARLCQGQVMLPGIGSGSSRRMGRAAKCSCGPDLSTGLSSAPSTQQHQGDVGTQPPFLLLLGQ